MTPNESLKWVLNQPFIPFTLTLSNGREITIPHPEYVSPGKYGALLYILHPVGQVEVIDVSFILSFRTVHEASLSVFEEPPADGENEQDE